ncbi:MAG TPA: AAA family ATPase [Gemmatimonadales bacterium]|jgi:DNA-binding SARP family transcriptional activator|nr:AAA family ATPase [Gemmatimonadales bacterium]
MIVCRTLGPVEVTTDGAMASGELLWRKNLALLVYLARSDRRGRTREHLTGLLWADRPEAAARHSLNEALRVLRRHAGDTAIETAAGQVRLVPGAVRLDVDELLTLTERGEWSAASGLITGEFLEGFALPDASAFEDWLAVERGTWRACSVDVLVHRVEELLRAGDAQRASAVARRALALEPRSERALRAAIRALALAGDRGAALELYGKFAARLSEEAGAAPERETEALADRVRRQPLARPAAVAGREHVDLAARLPLAGREAELQRLLDAAAKSRATSRSAVLIVEGESGTGKTRLVEELLARLRLDGAIIATARAVDMDRAEPWSGALVLARGGLAAAPGIAAAPADAIAAFAAAVPEWAERFPGAGAAHAMPLGRALSQIVRAAAEDQAVVLAVDDAQWLDTESTGALVALLRDLAASPVTIVLALSPHPPRPDLDDLRSRIGRDAMGGVVHLAAISAAALRALAERLLPGYDAVELDRVVRRVGTDSAGLPLIAVELLRAVAAGLDLGATSSVWPEPLKTLDQTLPGDLPDAVVAAIRIGFRRLSPDAQRVLAAASALGDRVSAARAATALGLPLDRVHHALDELEWQHWLISEPRGYGFVARVVRQIIERDMLTAGQRRRIFAADPGA